MEGCVDFYVLLYAEMIYLPTYTSIHANSNQTRKWKNAP